MHIPVLLPEVLAGLSLKQDDVVLDATAGAGGHSEAIARLLGRRGMLIALDADSSAVARVRKRLEAAGLRCRYKVLTSNFRHLDRALEAAGVREVTKVLFDLGLSSDQLESSGRGFSFRVDEPLLMTFASEGAEASEAESLTASEIVNTWDESSIADVLQYYGEERFARRIARAIVRGRREKPIATTEALGTLIEQAVPKRNYTRLHPATKTFQALRIAVNDEIGALREGITKAYEHLGGGGRMAVISFHSIEDRVVKRFMKAQVLEGGAIEVARKPITPGEAEQALNPRARSAKLRILEKQ